MAKKGMSKTQTKSLLRTAALGPGWALCVGAGISRPAFPDWNELVRRLAARDPLAPTPEALRFLQAAYSPDALIQAAMDRLGLTEEQFAIVLAEELYSDAEAALPAGEPTKLFVRALTSRHIGGMPRTLWQEFIDLVTVSFPDLTALRLAATLSGVLQGPAAPTAILSFNAEPLFPA